MYKIVYVLTDNENLKYYNELMISLLSVRKHMPDRPVCVLVDPTTYAILQKNDAEIFNLAEVLSIEVPTDLTQAEKSRYLKVTCRQWIRGDMLFIDTDTVICRPFPDKVSDKPLGFVLDGHSLLSQAPVGQYFGTHEFNLQLGVEIKRDSYYNSGVMWVRDNDITKAFFSEWEQKWQETRKNGSYVDQPSFNFVINDFEQSVATLDGIWNLQIAFGIYIPINTLNNAMTLHYFNDINSPYSLCDPNIKKLRYDNPKLAQIIDNPLGSFQDIHIIYMDKIMRSFVLSRQYSLLKDILYTKHKKLFALNEKILGFLGKLRGKRK